MAEFESNYHETIDNFEALNLNKDLRSGVLQYGFESPSDVQKRAIQPIIDGRDVVIQAPSQSDRASATAIGVLQNVDPKDEKIQALILTPSRESANRLERLYLNLGQSIDVPCLVCSGGSSVADDLSALESNPPVVIGTPRRIADLIERGALKAGTIRRFALDHADELVSRGHTADIYHIFEKSVFEPRQVVMLSETMPPEVMDMSSELVTNSPACIKVG